MDVVTHNVLLWKRKPMAKLKQRRHSTSAIGAHVNIMHCTARVKSAGNMIGYKSAIDVKKSIKTDDIVLLGDQVTMVTVIIYVTVCSLGYGCQGNIRTRESYCIIANCIWLVTIVIDNTK